MGGNILRAFRPSGVHERVARARRTWGELSLAEQIAIGGLGGLGALTAARLFLGPRGDETRELVDRYAKAGATEKGEIAGLCTSRVHDLRDLLLDTKRAKVARMIFSDVEMSLDSSVTRVPRRLCDGTCRRFCGHPERPYCETLEIAANTERCVSPGDRAGPFRF